MNNKLLTPFFVLTLSIAALLTPEPALASDLAGKVTSVTVWTTSTGTTWGRVDLDTSRITVPACAAANPKNRYVFKISTDAGKGILSLFLLARSSGLPVWIGGTAACPAPSEGAHVSGLEELNTAGLN